MDIAGYDSVVFTSVSSENVARALTNRLLDRWPALLMDVEKLDSRQEVNAITTSNDCVSAISGERHAVVYYYRDNEMRQHFRDKGWVIDVSNEGPFSIHFRQRRNGVFELSGINELCSGETRIGKVDPYPAILCSPNLLEITLVSPGDPAIEPFSGQLLSLLSSSILAC
jgi:hypothetical protein